MRRGPESRREERGQGAQGAASAENRGQSGGALEGTKRWWRYGEGGPRDPRESGGVPALEQDKGRRARKCAGVGGLRADSKARAHVTGAPRRRGHGATERAWRHTTAGSS